MEKGKDAACGATINAGNSAKLFDTGTTDRFDGIKMAQKDTLALPAYPWNIIQNGTLESIRLELPMVRNGEPVRLIPDLF